MTDNAKSRECFCNADVKARLAVAAGTAVAMAFGFGSENVTALVEESEGIGLVRYRSKTSGKESGLRSSD